MRPPLDELGAGLGSDDLPSLTLWIAKRLALSVLILLGVSILVFAATQALPGDPARQILGHAAATEQLAALRHELGLDRPLLSQYLHWLGDLLRGSLGHLADDARVGLERDLGPRPQLARARRLLRAASRSRSRCCSARSPPCAATARSTTSRSSCCSC